MTRRVLILGASYGSLLGTKLVMAGHHVTLVCRRATADLINAEGTEVRLRLRGEDAHRAFCSADLPGTLDAAAPDEVQPESYDLVALAMSEPQYGADDIRALLGRIAASGVPCLSIMNMPPLPYLRRIPGLEAAGLADSFNHPGVWEGFDPARVTLCSPDPQAFRPEGEPPNVLHVGLPTNFKAAPFDAPEHAALLHELAAGIEALRVEGQDVPVKLRVHDSVFVPFAKWAMLLTGNYRCVLDEGVQPIRAAVHDDPARARATYDLVNAIVRKLGAAEADLVAFEKYAAAAEGLLKPSSAARAIAGGATQIERVDKLVKRIADQLGLGSPLLDETVSRVDARLAENQRKAG